MDSKVFIAKEDIDYSILGIEKEVAIWEDSLRTSGDRGSYEWWYFDAEYENGIKIVVIFYTKDRFDADGPANPKASIDITLQNGTNIYYVITGEEGEKLDASKIKCDVRLNDSYIKYDEGKYYVRFVYENLEYNCVMTTSTPMWRPDTGHIYFDNDRKHYFAWLVAQPQASVTGCLKLDNHTVYMDGIGYHDHNWGNCRMDIVMENWYWARSIVGPYTIIAFDIISKDKKCSTKLPIMYIKKNTEDKAIYINHGSFLRTNSTIHHITGKVIDNKLIFSAKEKDGTVYNVELIRGKDIGIFNLIDAMGYSSIRKYVGQFLNKKPTYVRIVGEVILEICRDGINNIYYGDGIWEQMNFS